jgi:hypothetical protein
MAMMVVAAAAPITQNAFRKRLRNTRPVLISPRWSISSAMMMRSSTPVPMTAMNPAIWERSSASPTATANPEQQPDLGYGGKQHRDGDFQFAVAVENDAADD